MKKLLSVALAAIIGASAFAGENFKSILGVGFGLPLTSGAYNNSDFNFDAKQTAYGADVTWVGILTESGLSFKADAFIGGISCSDIDDKLKALDKEICAELSFDLGAGYSFIRTDAFTLGAFGVLGLSVDTFNYSLQKSNYDRKASVGAVSFDIGADIFANYKFTNMLGVYADLGFRGMFGKGNSKNKVNDQTVSDIELDYKGFKFLPAIGLSFTF